MRHLAALVQVPAALVLAIGFVAGAADAMPVQPAPGAGAAAHVLRVEYFCSPGFEPSYGGTCVATPQRPEIELFIDEPGYEGPVRIHRRVRRHHGLRESY